MTGGLRLGCVLTVALAMSAVAQEAPVPPERPRDAMPAAPAGDPDTPPYMAKLERLATLMGTLAFLRDLCGDRDGSVWRDKMTDLLGAEGTTTPRRARLAGAFNKGFEDYRLNYRSCTPAAETVIARSLAEGASLSRELAARYGT